MAVKTFTTGEVLTAADTNTYLANGGLVHVKSQTMSATGVTSVTVSNAFNSTYDNYRVVVSGLQASAPDTNVYCKFEAVLGTYNFASTYWSYGGVGGNGNAASTTAGLLCGITSTSNDGTMSFDLFAPNLAKFTHLSFLSASTNYYIVGGGIMKTALAYTDLILFVTGITINSGTIDVYGYRKG